MTKRVSWKKGMRLTDEILKASDLCQMESLKHALALSSAGRMGLLPSTKDFNISISVDNGQVDVESLTCLAVTKNGDIVDIDYDTTYTNNIETRVDIPSDEGDSYILVVGVDKEWKDIDGGLCEPQYLFRLVPENHPLSLNEFPLARIVNEYGWRMDEINFVPPCLYVSSHVSYISLLNRFASILETTSSSLLEHFDADCKTAIGVFWPSVEYLKISLDKDIDLMSPMMLLGNVQKYISAFFCGCMADETLNLADPGMYVEYINVPYDYKDVYSRIKEGLDLCDVVVEKLPKLTETVKKEPEVEVLAPTISAEHLVKRCSCNDISIPVNVNTPGATVYYTIDGSEPTTSSRTGSWVKFKSDFKEKGKEDDKLYTIKVRAAFNGKYSTTNTYSIRLQKDLASWNGKYKI